MDFEFKDVRMDILIWIFRWHFNRFQIHQKSQCSKKSYELLKLYPNVSSNYFQIPKGTFEV